MRIVFVCKHNVYRSKVAEAVFNKYNKNKNNKAISRGIFPSELRYENTINSVKAIGYDIDKKSRGFNLEELRNQDLIIIVADDVPKSLFDQYKIKTIIWRIKDINEKDVEGKKKTAKKIEKKVIKLIKEIG